MKTRCLCLALLLGLLQHAGQGSEPVVQQSGVGPQRAPQKEIERPKCPPPFLHIMNSYGVPLLITTRECDNTFIYGERMEPGESWRWGVPCPQAPFVRCIPRDVPCFVELCPITPEGGITCFTSLNCGLVVPEHMIDDPAGTGLQGLVFELTPRDLEALESIAERGPQIHGDSSDHPWLVVTVEESPDGSLTTYHNYVIGRPIWQTDENGEPALLNAAERFAVDPVERPPVNPGE